MRPLLLIDINGTLVERDARTDLPFVEAVERLFGREGVMSGVDTTARSDWDVFLELQDRYGTGSADQAWLAFQPLYADRLDAWQKQGIWRPQGDVCSVIPSWFRQGHRLVLLTGEHSLGARAKLEVLGIWHCFATGGFGEDARDRLGIARSALRRAVDLWGEGATGDVLVIGDTLLDIQTARELGATAVALNSGTQTSERLLQAQPDLLANCFSEIDDWLTRRR